MELTSIPARCTDELRDSYDAVVIGAGPSGCAVAIALANKGASVLLLEASPKASQRLAGEWLHPPGVRALETLGVMPILEAAGHAPGQGFVVYPDDGSEPIRLQYASGNHALCLDHEIFVNALRHKASSHPGVTYAPGFRATALDQGWVQVTGPRRTNAKRIQTPLNVGAEGRSSIARRALNYAAKSPPLSYMAGLILEVDQLPHEGYGHVLLGGPGPVTLYRISDRHVRVCLDLPAEQSARRDADFIWRAYRVVMPEPLVRSFKGALDRTKLAWAANRFCPRTRYGEEGIALVGDSVGYCHPLTAVGMTLGIEDALALAESGDVATYQRERERASYVAELLSSALYDVFQRDDVGAEAIRQAMYRMWRQNPADRERTMRILTGDDSHNSSFARTFLKVATGAVADLVRESRDLRYDTSPWEQLKRALGDYGAWLQWPLASVMPSALRRHLRPRSRSDQPLPYFPFQLKDRASSELDIASAEPERVEAALKQLHARLDQRGNTLQDQPSGSPPESATSSSRAFVNRLNQLVESLPDEFDTLAPVVDQVLETQTRKGSFSSGAVIDDIELTAAGFHILASFRTRWPGHRSRRVDTALRDATRWLRNCQSEDGGWASPLLTAKVVRALLASGMRPSNAILRRAIHNLCSTQDDKGRWSDRGSDELLTTAHVLRALREASASQWPTISRGLVALSELLGDEAWQSSSERAAVVSALDPRLGDLVSNPNSPRSHKRDVARCHEHLLAVSRTFSRPIEMLPGELRIAVSTGYLLCRVADTVEDLPDIAPRKREALFTMLIDVMAEQKPATEFSALFSTLDVDQNHPDSQLALELDCVMRVFSGLPESMRYSCQRWIQEMVRGMALYSQRVTDGQSRGPTTTRDLERYCYFVAGTVGHMLTELFLEHFSDATAATEHAMWRNAESFGVALQLVNILKDVSDDHARGVTFIPWLERAEAGLDGRSLIDPECRQQAHRSVTSLFARAQQLLGDAFDYVLAIPSNEREIRLFCLLPLWMAVRTLQETEGNDAQFSSERPVKISRSEVEKLIANCVEHCSDDRALRREFERLRAGQLDRPILRVAPDIPQPQL